MNRIACDQRAWPIAWAKTSMKRDHEAAEHGAGQVADPAEDGGGERLQAGVEAEVEPDEAEVLTLEHAGRARQGATDEERHHDRLVEVDAHQLGGLLVLGRGAHRASEPGPADEGLEHAHHHERDAPG